MGIRKGWLGFSFVVKSLVFIFWFTGRKVDVVVIFRVGRVIGRLSKEGRCFSG